MCPLSNLGSPACIPFLSQEEENRLREELRQEWEAKQEKIKSEYSPSGTCMAWPGVLGW